MANNHVIKSVSEITPNIYLTSVYGATRENIERKGITLLVNSAQELPKQELTGVESIKLYLDDTPSASINVYFDHVADKIHEHVSRGGRVMIHCLLGVSRSTTLLLAYFLKHKNMSLNHAYDHVSARRPIIRPNPGFWRQLADYEKKLASSYTRMTSNFFGASSSRPAESTSIPITITSSSTPRNSSSTVTAYNGAGAGDSSSFIRPFSASRSPLASTSSFNGRSFNDYGMSKSSSLLTPSSSSSTSKYSKYISPMSFNLNDDYKFISKPVNYSTTYRSSYGSRY